MTREDYNSWRHELVTRSVLQFLRDKQEYIKHTALESWVMGSDQFASINQTVRGQIIELQEMIDLPFEAIEAFYKEKEENGTESEGTSG